MTQQILDGNRPLGIHLPDVRPLFDRDPNTAQFGEIFGDGVAEQKSSFLPEHHRRHRDDRLGHRIDAKDAVHGHRCAARGIALAKTLEVGQLSAPRDQRHGAGHEAALDFALYHPAKTRKTCCGKSDIFGSGALQRE
jgi:hypothetical protein